MPAMVCNLCGAQEATIHLTEIVNNQMIEIHLCESCAQEKGTDFKTHFQMGDLMSTLMGSEKPAKGGADKRLAGKCPECGLTYEEFGKSGRLGCAFCYDSFSKLLTPLIKRVQRSLQHVGKRPQNVSAAPASIPVSGNPDLKILQDRLKKSIQSEAFEEAAKIRDEIRQLEEKQKKPRKGKSE